MKDLHLTTNQYLDLLKVVRKDLDNIEKVMADDYTITGRKYTISNVGLCAAEETKSGWKKHKYTTLETAMWPEDFKTIGKTKHPYPQQFTMKYRRGTHKCPLDIRKHGGGLGCFYNCLLFSKKLRTPTMKEIKDLYDKQIEKVSKWINHKDR